MPYAPKKPCASVGCGKLVESGKRHCAQHASQLQKQVDERRGSSSKRGYNSRWRKARETYLMRNPLCRECRKVDRLKAATVVDHIVPHRGDSTLFWDTTNWQPLCKEHHDAKTAREDGAFGNPRRGEGV